MKWIGVASALGIATLAACSSPSEQSGSEAAKSPDTSQDSVQGNSTNGAIVSDKARRIALDTQGIAPVGLTVRVKGIEIGTDATILDVSASYGGTDTNNVPLASDPTYLQDEQGNKLMLKPPKDNPRLHILRGQQMDGQLVFLGAVPAGAKALTLVINNNNAGDDLVAPGLSIPLKLDSSAR